MRDLIVQTSDSDAGDHQSPCDLDANVNDT